MMKQGQAVFEVVTTVFTSGEAVPETSRWSGEQKNTVYGKLFTMFKEGIVQHSKNPSDAELLKYIPGLVNNWVRKDPRMNGGVKYEAKNPGSRTGSGDPAIKAMRDLLKITSDETDRAKIEACIKARQAEVKPVKTVEINVAALPEELRALVK